MLLVNSLMLQEEERCICLSVLFLIRLFIIFYVNMQGKENAISSLRDLTDYVSILLVDAEVIRKALYSEFSDYEDAIQHYAALQDA